MSDPLQRHLSDSYAFVPRKPSRLGPGHPSRPQVRGTVSMPTSPILTRQTTSLWPDPPQSARSFFDLPTADPEPTSSGSWFPDAYPSSTETIQLNLKDDIELEHQTQPQLGYCSPQSLGQGDSGSAEPARKKRAQVRIACIHCQKACKKCSNTRPCERCVKYGLKDCIDSTRKPRKTGIKRGPYKRRASIKYQDSIYSSSSPPPSNRTHPSHAFNPLGPGYQTHHAAAGAQSNIPMGLVGADYISSTNQTATYAAQSSTVPRTRPAAFSTTHGSTTAAGAAAAAATSSGIPGPPGPRAAALHGAMVRALSGPRWVNGQRTGSSSSTAEVMYPPTPVVPFPISLNHQDDPFSRAVSPIHGDLDSALFQGLKTHMSGDPAIPSPFAQTGTGGTRVVQAGSSDPSVNLDFNPFEPQSSMSAPTSPRISAWDSTPPGIVAGARASSAEPMQTSNHWTLAHPLSTTMTGEPLHSPAIVALQKIRRPSLRTLMSRGGSLASSRQTSPIPESQSPTLYNQPMELDEGMDTMGMSSAAGFEWSGGEFATTGQSGQIPGVEDRLDEQLNLMGPFDNPFQT